MPPVRCVLLGCGQIARVHAERFAADRRGILVAVYDPLPAAAHSLQLLAAPAALVCHSLEELLALPDIDAAIICTPTGLHFEHVQACRARGWAVLCEKPLAETGERIQQLIAEAAFGPPVAVAYQRRHTAVFRTLRREIQSGKYGPVLSIASHNAEYWEQSQALPNTWRNDPAQNPGGYIGDAGSHKIDSLFYITGLRPERVFAMSHKGRRKVEIVSSVSAQCSGEEVIAIDFLGHAHHFTEMLHIVCEEADFKLINGQLWRGQHNQLELFTDWEPESNPISGLFDLLSHTAPNLAPAQCAWPVYQFTQAILESARTGQVISLKSR